MLEYVFNEILDRINSIRSSILKFLARIVFGAVCYLFCCAILLLILMLIIGKMIMNSGGLPFKFSMFNSPTKIILTIVGYVILFYWLSPAIAEFFCKKIDSIIGFFQNLVAKNRFYKLKVKVDGSDVGYDSNAEKYKGKFKLGDEIELIARRDMTKQFLGWFVKSEGEWFKLTDKYRYSFKADHLFDLTDTYYARYASNVSAIAYKTFYEEYGIDKNATEHQIKEAYHKLVKQHHPDKNGSEGMFKKIQFIYETLSDPKKRSDYDDYLKQNGLW